MKSRYEAVIGLEVHTQLATASKIFCPCATTFGAAPNSQTCPVCLGLPGALPVLNRKVVEFAIRAGLATHCAIAPRSIFARKNYFYPDLPKGYQISQFELPICVGGFLEIETEGGERKSIGIARIHMEEDAGKLLHPADGSGCSLVDLNRAGTPLLEIVSEPDLRSADEAVAYLRKLHQTVVYLGICDGNMEEGSFRCDANVSVRLRGETKLGTRAELKNINSFRFVKQAIEYEIERQIDLIEGGGAVVQETRLFDSAAGLTRSMRGKEEAHDYRYFPDPDLVPVLVSEAWIDTVRAELPELPDAKIERFTRSFLLSRQDAEVLAAEAALAGYFEATVSAGAGPKAAANWIMGDFIRALNDSGLPVSEAPLPPQHLAEMIRRIEDGTISGKIAKTVFQEMWESGEEADRIIEAKGLRQVTDTGAIEQAIDAIIAANPEQAAQYRAGKEKVFGFFVGQVMKATKGKANPQAVNDLLKQKLSRD
ncbi:MAG: Asp-tRNA(Asn)/Glu-tRNA(Gln) amidotransferase subunit GatB [Deltaproteobacteria bacterium]|nr:Asp-tRNA(Asn)/Glu-tRNA(Gln) amidotransferase subunit GatB [Deltaproteobacteria bacterium]